MRAKSKSTQSGLVLLAVGVLVAAGPVSAAHADAATGLSATISVSASQATAGDTLQVSAMFTPTADVGATQVGIDVLGADGQAVVTVSSTSPELSSCGVSGSTVACAWDLQAADGAQTLTIEVAIDPGATGATWTARALGGIAGTAPISLAETSIAVAAAPAPILTIVVETTTTAAVTTTTAPATTAPTPETTTTTAAAVPVPVEQAPPATSAAPATTTTTIARTNDLPTTGTDSDRSVRLALAIMIGGLGLVMLARRDRPLSGR